MKKALVKFAVGLFCITVVPFAMAQSIVVGIQGTSDSSFGFVPDINGDGTEELALCFDLKMVDLATGLEIGTAKDCLFKIEDLSQNGAIGAIETMFLNFANGELVVRNLVSAQPKLHGMPGLTHVVGGVPGEGISNALSATGNFKDKSVSARQYGGIQLGPNAAGGFTITADSVVLIDIK